MKGKKILALLLALAMAFGMMACGEKDTGDSAKVVAKVGDVEITQGQWDAYSALVYYGQGYDLSQIEVTEENEPYLTYLKNSMLSSLVSAKLLELDYKEQGIDVLGETYKEDVKQFRTTAKTQLSEFLKNNNVSDDDLTMYYDCQKYLAYAMDETTVKDEDVKKYYDENSNSFLATEDMVRASHILVEEESTAKDIISQYEGGADFAELAAEYGTDGTASNGGDLGPFVYGDMVEDFSKAAFALGVNEYSKEPVKSDFGYHVILVTGRVGEGELQPYDWVKETILTNLETQDYYAKMDELMEKYEIEYFVEGMTGDEDGGDAKQDGDGADGAETDGQDAEDKTKE